jgi:hypothetical protein
MDPALPDAHPAHRRTVAEARRVLRHAPRGQVLVIRTVAAAALLLSLAAGQSFFNNRGLGEIAPPADARIVGLGSPSALSYLNPGINVSLPQTRFNGSILGAGAIGSQAGSDRIVGGIRPGGLHTAVPLPLGARLLLGLDQRFGQDFDIWTDSLPTSGHRYHVVGRGGIYALNGGLAWSIFETASIGVQYSRLLGASREDWQLELAEGSYSSTDTVQINYSGNSLRLGLSVQRRAFAFGALYRPSIDLTAESYRRVHGLIEDSVVTYQLHVPHEFAAGGSYQPVEGMSIVAGFEYRPWSGITVDGAERGFLDAYRLSAGLEYYVTPRYPVRLGYSFSPWYYEAVVPGPFDEQNPISDNSLHLGTSIPIPEFGSLDIGAEVSRRTSNNLTETAGRLFFSLSYRESWGKRTRRWGS